jgi:flagellum-specific peptidoglycan hydrolase FlgJ
MSGPIIPAAVIAAARAAQAKYRVPASVSLAQWALESGWGAHAPGNNPFGIKAMAGFGTQQFATHEVVHGHLVACQQTFAAFVSIDQAFAAHALLLSTAPVYRPAFAALPDRARFITLMAAHYATDPHYAAKIEAVIQSHGLGQYDQSPGAS